MASSYPKVRGACEYCHRRKIRCILPPGGNACHNCAATRTTCLFAPRAKAGRPRRSPEDPSRQQQLAQSADCEATEPAEAFEGADGPLEALESRALGARGPAPEDPWGLDDPSGHYKGLQIQPQVYFPDNRPQWHDFSQSDELSGPSTPGTQELLPDLGLPTPSASTTAQFPGTANRSNESLSTGHLTPALSNSGLPGDSDWAEAFSSTSQLDFDAALKLCADLDHRSRLVKDSDYLQNAEAHLQILDSLCMVAIKTRPSTDSASRSLILAALHKALEVCDTLVCALRSGTKNTETAMLQQMHLLRRLDIVVTFSRISLLRMGQASGTKVAETIHSSIEGLLKADYSHWAW